MGYHAGMRRTQLGIGLILTAYLIAGVLYASKTPAWQAPDEPAHYNYNRQLAGGEWPIIAPGDYNQAYQTLVISSRFAPQYSVSSFEYEDYQPPLYYLLLTPIFRLTAGQLVPLRLASVLLGAGVIGLAYATARRLFPDQLWLALSVAAFMAFLPQHVAMLSAVNNDSLAELLIAAMFYCLVVALHRPDPLVSPKTGWALGLLLGAGFLTKVTAYLMAPVLALVVIWLGGRDWRAWGRMGGRIFGPALLLGGAWWLRNIVVYPGLDAFGIAAHDAVVTGQPTTAEWLRQYGGWGTLRAFVTTTFHSFWGQFGWMGVPMPTWIYRILGGFTLVTAVGALAVERRPALAPVPTPGRLVRTLFRALVGLNVLLYLVYNARYVQHQGRYFFPALLPLSLALALSWAFWLQPLYRRRPILAYLLPLGLALGLWGLDLLALFQFIVPQLKG